jgi:hypothetical protein
MARLCGARGFDRGTLIVLKLRRPSLDRFPGNSEPLTHNGNLRDVRWSSILLATSSHTDASSNISFLMTGSSVTQKI